MVLYTPGQWLFVPSTLHAHLPIRVTSVTATTITGTTHEGEHITVAANTPHIQPVTPAGLNPVPNLVHLEELSEAAILHNLRQRYGDDQIYTNTSSIVLSINPYKLLPCYGPNIINQYKHAASQPNSPPPPHVYALADSAYRQLLADKKNQSILISGESGAGKTEATKLVLQYLAECSSKLHSHAPLVTPSNRPVSHSPRNTTIDSGAAAGGDATSAGTSDATVEQQILEANPIIEAFGNAKTVRNNNSSRFGKWMNIIFDQGGQIASSQIVSYLLEKSRVTQHAMNERNFHIFYYLTQGCTADERTKYQLRDASQYRILSMGGLHTSDSTDVDNPMVGNNASKLWAECKSAMSTLNYTSKHIDSICRILSFILHLSNVEFTVDSSTDKVVIANDVDITTAATVLGIDKTRLTEVLLTKILLVSNKPIITFNSVVACADVRDSMCKSVYDRLFTQCIELINQQLYTPVKQSIGSIGILDIFGFENFAANSFEQLLINYTNEVLQKYFTTQLFVLEQAEYKAEGVPTPHIEYVDNQKCIELIDAKNVGIIDMIAEEIRLPKGSDTNLLHRMHDTLTSNTHYVKPKTKSPTFGVKHFADVVVYNIDMFCIKNKDYVGDNVTHLLTSSTHQFVSSLYNMGDMDPMSPDALSPGGARIISNKNVNTLGKSFRQQVQQLMQSLSATTPHFIRCIKPNHTKQADQFDSQFVLKQLQYLGIKQVIQVRQAGYSIRKTHAEFYARYHILVEASQLTRKNAKADCETIMKHSKLADKSIAGDWCVGTNKVLMRQNVQLLLENLRELSILSSVIKIQSVMRRRLAVVRYKLLKTAVRSLTQLMDSKSIELELIDTALDHCIEYAAPHKLVQKGKVYRNSVYEYVQCRAALVHAMASKDVQLLQTAVANGETLVNKSQIPLPELQTAKQLLQRIQQHITNMTAAMQQRDIHMLESGIHEGESLGMMATQQHRDAVVLLQRLQQEKVCERSMQAALQSGIADELRSAVQQAADIGLSKSNTVLMQCRSRLAELEKTENLHAVLTEAMNDNDPTALREALAQCDAAKLNDNMYQQAYEMLQQLTRKPASMSPAKAAPTPQQQAQSQKVRLITDYLMNAIESNDVDVLHNTIQHAGDNGVTDVKPYQAAVALYTKLNEITDALNDAAESTDMYQLDTAIHRAVEAGMLDTYEPLQRAQQVRSRCATEQDDVAVLQQAIKLADLNMLLHAQQRCDYMSTSPLYQRAAELISELRAEQNVRDMDLQSSLSSYKAGKSTALKSGLLSRRLSMTSDINEWRNNPKYAIHLLPTLRTPDEFAKGKLIGKGKFKLTMLQHTKESIPRSLTKVSFYDHDAFNQLAVQLFKSVQGYMGDRSYSFSDTLAAELLQNGIEHPVLRDEIYLQLIKQLTNNSRQDSVVRGWQLLALVSETFGPSPDTSPFIFKWIAMFTDIKEFCAKHYVQYTLKTLALNKAALTKPPFIQYITTFKDRVMSATFATVYMPDQSTVQLMIDPTQTCMDVVQHVCTSLGVPAEHASKFGLFDVTVPSNSVAVTTVPDLYIQHSEYILDYIASETQLHFRMRLLPDHDAVYDSTVACSIMYHQLMTDIAANKYTMQRDVLVQVQALHERLLDQTDRTGAVKKYDLAQYPVCTTANSVIEFHTDVQSVYESMTPDVSPLQLLDLVKMNCATAGCYWFIVTQTEYKHIPQTLLLGVNLTGVFVAHNANKSILLQWPYKQINGWANNSSRFCIRVYDAQRQVEQYNFATKIGSRIVQVIQDHVDSIMVQKAAAKQAGLQAGVNSSSNGAVVAANTSVLHTNVSTSDKAGISRSVILNGSVNMAA